jgi:uncharacterized membrane protein YczE
MTGLAARGHSVRVVRTAIELAVLAAGWVLGGTVGIGTLLYAVAIGPLAHVFLPMLKIKTPEKEDAEKEDAGHPDTAPEPVPSSEHVAGARAEPEAARP